MQSVYLMKKKTLSWNKKSLSVHPELSDLSSPASAEALMGSLSHFHNTDYSLALDQNESVIKGQLAFHSWNPELDPRYERKVLSDTC